MKDFDGQSRVQCFFNISTKQVASQEGQQGPEPLPALIHGIGNGIIQFRRFFLEVERPDQLRNTVTEITDFVHNGKMYVFLYNKHYLIKFTKYCP